MASGLGGERLPSGCTSGHARSGTGSNRCGHCSSAASSTACISLSPSDPVQCSYGLSMSRSNTKLGVQKRLHIRADKRHSHTISVCAASRRNALNLMWESSQPFCTLNQISK